MKLIIDSPENRSDGIPEAELPLCTGIRFEAGEKEFVLAFLPNGQVWITQCGEKEGVNISILGENSIVIH